MVFKLSSKALNGLAISRETFLRLPFSSGRVKNIWKSYLLADGVAGVGFRFAFPFGVRRQRFGQGGRRGSVGSLLVQRVQWPARLPRRGYICYSDLVEMNS